MNKIPVSTEKIILDAAKIVFLEKGFDRARMQLIAEKAGINKALLHYYFRSKERLFNAIFEEAFNKFIPNVNQLLQSDKPFREIIEDFISIYIDMLTGNPHLPIFILSELKRSPENFVKILNQNGFKPEKLEVIIQKEVAEGRIKPVVFQHLVVNIVGMCVFSFIGQPIIQGILFKGKRDDYQKFLTERKTEISKFVLNALN